MADSAVDTALALLDANPVFDGHNDLPWAIRALFAGDLEAVPLDQVVARTRTDLPRLRQGRVGAQFWSVYVPSSLSPPEAVAATLEQIDLVRRMVARYPDQLGPATGALDIRRLRRQGRVASLIGAEGGHCIAGSLDILRAFYDLGVRYLTLTHNDNVPWADSATDRPRLGGLNDFGRDVVREMNGLGMLVDLSHVSEATMHGVLDVADAPVIFSHSSSRALVDHPRNVPDDVLVRLADNGGVCMATFVPAFVSAACREWHLGLDEELAGANREGADTEERAAITARYEQARPKPHATVEDVADHIEHIRDVVGVQHVGIGGDFDGCDDMPAGLDDVSTYPVLFAELLDRGWSSSDCAALAGGNLLRVLEEAECQAGAGSGGSQARTSAASSPDAEENIRSYYRAVDARRIDEIIDLFEENAVYLRPGYPPLVGRSALRRFYTEDRVIESGRHHVNTLVTRSSTIAVEGFFAGRLRNGQSTSLNFADFWRLAPSGRVRERVTYFHTPLV